MKKISSYTLFAVLFLSLLSCSNYAPTVLKFKDAKINITERKMVDTTIFRNLSFKIGTVTIDSGGLLAEPSFIKEKTTMVPLVIWNYWHHRTVVNIGAKQFEPSVETYFKTKFEQALQQAGYTLDNSTPNTTIDIHVKKFSSWFTSGRVGFFNIPIIPTFKIEDYEGTYNTYADIEIIIHKENNSSKLSSAWNRNFNRRDFNVITYNEMDRIELTQTLTIAKIIKDFIPNIK